MCIFKNRPIRWKFSREKYPALVFYGTKKGKYFKEINRFNNGSRDAVSLVEITPDEYFKARYGKHPRAKML